VGLGRSSVSAPFLTGELSVQLHQFAISLIACAMFGVAPLSAGAAASDHDAMWPAVASPIGEDPKIEERIDALMMRMSLEEKVGQTIMAEIKSISPRDVTK